MNLLLLNEVMFGEVEVLLPSGRDDHPLPQLRVGARHVAHHLRTNQRRVLWSCDQLATNHRSSPAAKTRNQAPCTHSDPSHVHPE